MPSPDSDLVPDFDLVIVGGGGSGLAAAAEASALGARVVVIEKADRLGGQAIRSLGTFSTSSTPHQRRAGIDDDPQRHFADMDLVNAKARMADNMALRRLLVFEAPLAFRWLTELGVEFIGPYLEPPHTVPRLHTAVPGPSGIIYHLARRCRRNGVEIKLSRNFLGFVFDGDRVAGVEVEGPDGRETLRGRAVILAAGDFSGNRSMRERFFGPEVVNAEAAYPGNTGDTILAAERRGARIVNGGHGTFYMPRMRFVAPSKPSWLFKLPPTRLVARAVRLAVSIAPAPLIRPFVMRFLATLMGPEPNLFAKGAALVGADGRLLSVDVKSPAKALALDPANSGFIVLDQALADQFQAWPNPVSTAPSVGYAYLRDYRKARPDIFSVAGDWAALGAKIGLPAGNLEAAIEAHNAAAPEASMRLLRPPFYALGPVRAYITTTEGGLAVDADLAVLDASGQAIPGLFAAGGNGQGGALLDGHGHHLAWATVSGRHAARRALGHPPLTTQAAPLSGDLETAST